MKWIQPPDDDVLFCCQGVFFIAYFFAAKTVKVIHAGQWEHWFLLFLSLWDSPLCDNTQYSNHCVTSPITSLYQKSARSAITLFDSTYPKCIRMWQVCDSSVSVDHQAITLPARMAGQHMLLYCCYLSTDTRPMTFECQIYKKKCTTCKHLIPSQTLW